MTPEEYATNEILKEEIKAVLETLQEREQEVLELRFGLIDGTSHTLEEVGKRFNVTSSLLNQELYKINKDIIGSNPNLIKVGQVLKIKESL